MRHDDFQGTIWDSEVPPSLPDSSESSKPAKKRKRLKPERLRWHNLDPDPLPPTGVAGPSRYWTSPSLLQGWRVPMKVTEIYCPNDRCLVRQVQIVTKHAHGEDAINWIKTDEEFAKMLRSGAVRDIVLIEETRDDAMPSTDPQNH